MKTYVEVRDWLDNGLTSYKIDPADSGYQEGYEACLKELYKFIYLENNKEADNAQPTTSVASSAPTSA